MIKVELSLILSISILPLLFIEFSQTNTVLYFVNYRAPLVPVFTFGEINTYTTHKIIPRILPSRFHVPEFYFLNGRGFLQQRFGLLPRKHPLTTVGLWPQNLIIKQILHKRNQFWIYLQIWNFYCSWSANSSTKNWKSSQRIDWRVSWKIFQGSAWFIRDV